MTEFRGTTISSVRRILKRGGGAGTLQNLRNIKIRKNIILFKISPSFRPKLGEEQKKKGLHPKLVRFFAQN